MSNSSEKNANAALLRVSHVRVGPDMFNAHLVEKSLLPFVGHPDLDDYPDKQTEVIFQLTKEEDGLLFEHELTVEQLTELAWSDCANAFVDKAGVEHAFFETKEIFPFTKE